MRKPHRTLAPIALAALLALGSAAVHSQTAPAHDVSIASQPLGQALNELARQTGLDLSFPADLVAGRTAPAVSGNLTVRQALDRLLAGSGLRAAVDGSNVTVRPVAQGEADELAPIVVTGRVDQETAAGPLHGYAAKRSATATKTDTPLIETPQSISVVGAQEIETLKSQSVSEAFGYVAGVARVEGVDRTTESLMIRGFEAWADNGSLYRDGIKYGVNLNNGTQEPYGLERIELLKGAASVLYGAAAPGGIVNTVSKRPTADALRELNVELGSFSRKQVSGDFGGALDAAGEWSYRLTFLQRDSDTFVDHVPDDRTYVAPALKWQPSAATSLTLLSEYQRDRTAYVYGLPVEGTVLPNPNGRIPRERFQGEPGFDKYDNERWSIGYLFEHAFNQDLKLRQNLRYFHQTNERPFIYTTTWTTADQREVERFAIHAEDRSRAVTADTSLEYRLSTGAIVHTMLLGLDYNTQRHAQTTAEASVAPLDLFTPTYGSPIGAMTPIGTRRNEDDRTGLYFQDQMKIADKWVVLLGGRQDWSHSDAKRARSSEWTREKTDDFTAKAGVVYLAGNGLAPFFSYSQSFQPEAGLDRNDNRFKPSEGEQYELGIRYQPANSDTLLSATVYDLTKTNVSVTDPVDPTFSAQLGKVRSRGLELEARTRVGRNVNLIAAYAYTDARTTKSSPLTPELDGVRTGGVPYNQASAWADYDFGGLGVRGLKAGVGVRYVDSTTGSFVNVTVPSFTLFDAMISYTTGAWRLALNANNVADKTYVASCTYACFYGEPRRVVATAGYRW
jgi:iron complex outermembrane receptor protein